MTFIVRLQVDDAGRVTGVVEQVRTGRKERFASVETLGQVIAEMAMTSQPKEP